MDKIVESIKNKMSEADEPIGMKDPLDGRGIQSARTLQSMYDGNNIKLSYEGRDGEVKEYRLNVSDIVKVLQDYEFDTVTKKVHTYLVNPRRR